MDEQPGAQGQQAEFALDEWLMFSWGVSWPAGNARASARWQDIATLSKVQSQTKMTGVDSGWPPTPQVASWYGYEIVLADGRTGTFGGYQGSMNPDKPPQPEPGKTQKLFIRQFAALLEDQVAKAQLPKAIDAFNAGKAIQFGPLTVISVGVTKHNMLFTWSMIKRVRLDPTFVTVINRKFLPQPAFITPLTQVTNYCVFAALVRDILARRPHTQTR